jgi:hypothetical protein
MEVGDLVTLSRYGKKISVNNRIRSGAGIIVEISGYDLDFAVVKVYWGCGHTMWHIGKDLKKIEKTT